MELSREMEAAGYLKPSASQDVSRKGEGQPAACLVYFLLFCVASFLECTPGAKLGP